MRTAGIQEDGGEDDVMKNLRLLKIKNWTICIQKRGEWRSIAEKVKTFKE
jgi:hypothetical protein